MKYPLILLYRERSGNGSGIASTLYGDCVGLFDIAALLLRWKWSRIYSNIVEVKNIRQIIFRLLPELRNRRIRGSTMEEVTLAKRNSNSMISRTLELVQQNGGIVLIEASFDVAVATLEETEFTIIGGDNLSIPDGTGVSIFDTSSIPPQMINNLIELHARTPREGLIIFPIGEHDVHQISGFAKNRCISI